MSHVLLLLDFPNLQRMGGCHPYFNVHMAACLLLDRVQHSIRKTEPDIDIFLDCAICIGKAQSRILRDMVNDNG